MDKAEQIVAHFWNTPWSAQASYDFAPLMKAQGPVEVIEVKARGPNRGPLALSSIIAETTKRNHPYIHQWIVQIVTSREYECSIVEHAHIGNGFGAFMEKQTHLSFLGCAHEADADEHLIIRLLLWTSFVNQPVEKFRHKRA